MKMISCLIFFKLFETTQRALNIKEKEKKEKKKHFISYKFSNHLA